MADFRDHYAEVTQKIITALETGTAPWRRPWDPNKVALGGPCNAVTGHRYRGINPLLLAMSAPAQAHDDPRWLSFKQAQDKGWQVRKGERASTVFFFKKVEVRESPDSIEESKTVPVLRSYPLFHASQVEGIPAFDAPKMEDVPWRTPESTAVILARSGAVLREGGERAFYAPAQDFIQMPPRRAFTTSEGWSATLLHEIGHWTGHPSRLSRDFSGRFGDKAYAVEELRAELASAFIGVELGIPSEIPNHASYVSSWLDVLKRDKREIFRASADAQRIADYVLAFHPLYADTKTDTASQEPVATQGRPMPSHIRKSLEKGATHHNSPSRTEEVLSWANSPRL